MIVLRIFNINSFLKLLIVVLFFCVNPAKAETASTQFEIILPSFVEIETVTSPVLIANITDETGNLQVPLTSKFRVTTNSSKPKTLYLKANTITDSGNEEAIFEYNGRVYIAFASLKQKPKHQSLVNCKMAIGPSASPGVVAYPIDAIYGATNKYLHGKGRYEITVKNGTTDISVNIGSHVLRDSFSTNDPKGFYQATLSLTESDI